MGKSVQIAGWVSEEKRKEFTQAVKKHKFLDGQSDFIKRAADALIEQSKSSKPALAEPLCFLTVKQREFLIAHGFKE